MLHTPLLTTAGFAFLSPVSATRRMKSSANSSVSRSSRLRVLSRDLWSTTRPPHLLKRCSRSPSLTLQSSTVPLLPQPPPLQVPGSLQPVHPGSQEDDDAARNQLGGDPALPQHHTFQPHPRGNITNVSYIQKHLVLSTCTFKVDVKKPQHEQLSVKMSPYHDGVGEVAISLALQPHGAELSGHVAIRGGFVKGGLPDTSHFRGHKEGQHALGSRNDNIKMSSVDERLKRPVWWVFIVNPASVRVTSLNVRGNLG